MSAETSNNPLPLDDPLLARLVHAIPASQGEKSSHWRFHTQAALNAGLDKRHMIGALSEVDGYGSHIPYDWLKQIRHSISHRFVFWGSGIFASPWYRIARAAIRQQRRILNIDALRNIFTLDFLQAKLPDFSNFESLCVIGDGVANFVSPLLIKRLSIKTVISINLPEILALDYLVLINSRTVTSQQVIIAESDDDLLAALHNPQVRLVMIPAHCVSILAEKDISMFVNIVSMQEMKMETIEQYFAAIRSNHAFFYCCNREHKKLYGGELIEFEKYPWHDSVRLHDSDCPWSQKYPISKWPFSASYDGNIKHVIAKFP